MILDKINLVKDTIDFNDIKKLISWLETNPKLTKGELTIDFEKKWSEWLGVKYSVFVPMLIKDIQEQQAQIEELKSLIK
jgi:dTDP-4-amino-4,6-dideoxygalactose transaminase